MLLIDFIALNGSNVFLATVLLTIFKLNDKKLLILLMIDFILNNIPIITIIVILLYILKQNIFKVFKSSFINEYILIIGFYFLFGFTLYGIYNEISIRILIFLLNNLLINMIIYYLGIKIIRRA